jgi:hypothetical protein
MKKLFFMLLILSACSEGEESNVGCLTGVNSSGDRVLIRCSTKAEFRAGSNVNAGGTANWKSFTQHQWEKCENCK